MGYVINRANSVPLQFFCVFGFLFSIEPKDAHGCTLSISNPLWDCAPCWDEWGADQPWSCLRWATQHLPPDECSCCSSRSCSSLWKITCGMFICFYNMVWEHTALSCFLFNVVYIIQSIYGRIKVFLHKLRYVGYVLIIFFGKMRKFVNS